MLDFYNTDFDVLFLDHSGNNYHSSLMQFYSTHAVFLPPSLKIHHKHQVFTVSVHSKMRNNLQRCSLHSHSPLGMAVLN